MEKHRCTYEEIPAKKPTHSQYANVNTMAVYFNW